MTTKSADLAEQIGRLATDRGLSVAAAESLTGGAVSSALAAAPEASTWYHGCVVAYSPRVKFDLLGVTPGPLVTDRCADELARGAARVLEADATVSTTGVGGPDQEEGEEPGTLYVGVTVPGGTRTFRVELDGDPAEVVERATEHALELLLDGLRGEAAAADGPDVTTPS
ncbi:CinA family protein [Ornithinimicrobium pekingense]|uniref:CinA C-terminal domain-containing protein n=1 Tax=Ornithinimicrobium pekingense TaxID=384677 RepID=A0ABQ2F8D7_9MICO|nr:CinA family protein [Ornithinimicrobium pekingense]GGK70803.1 hypothetical protein GCM10011509_19070 [Ornithinimicrobium pekingense]